ncbi:MAG: acyl-CoA thioesterase [Phenylobacterium zucineum]|nr:MAG: acyl-CoA thioesterase [Phenylobacterium zucineum]
MTEIPRDTAPTAGWMEGREHLLPIRIYYEDTDFTGVVYHGNYLRYFERGRSDFLRVTGVAHSALLDQAAAFTVVKMTLDFRRPARIDDALLVRTTLDGARGPRLFFNQKIYRSSELLCVAGVEAACIDMTGRPRKPTVELTAALAPLIG